MRNWVLVDWADLVALQAWGVVAYFIFDLKGPSCYTMEGTRFWCVVCLTWEVSLEMDYY